MSISRSTIFATITLAVAASSFAPAQTTPTPAPAGAAKHKPALFLIGDSTTRNGSWDNGATAGQFGWGHMMKYYFDSSKIYVVNDAMGGTSSRSFQTSPTLWPIVLPKIQPGDFVLMAFGHNDSGASIRGNGDETQPLPAARAGAGARGGRAAASGPATAPATATAPTTATAEVMHSFGWYMRQYVEQSKAKGATPIVLSLIPRNRWTNGKVGRNDADYALWAKQAADQEKVAFIPLYTMIADEYDKLGMDYVQSKLFPPNEAVHPNWAGASLNAKLVVEGIKGLKDCPLKDYLLPDPKVPETPDVVAPAHGDAGPSGKLPPDGPDRQP